MATVAFFFFLYFYLFHLIFSLYFINSVLCMFRYALIPKILSNDKTKGRSSDQNPSHVLYIFTEKISLLWKPLFEYGQMSMLTKCV